MRWPALLLLAATMSCHWIVGVEEREYDPVRAGCQLPKGDEASARIRVANFFADDGSIDLCVRPSGGSYGRPLFRDGGRDCPAGIAYPKVSTPIAVTPSADGRVDIKLVPADAGCDASGRELTRVSVRPRAITTIVRMGSPSVGERAEEYFETRSEPAVGSSFIRFLHASPGTPPLEFGVAEGITPPWKMSTLLFARAIGYGGATSASDRSIAAGMSFDDSGYLTTQVIDYTFGARPEGSDRAVVVSNVPRAAGHRTFFVIGQKEDAIRPLRALLCDENAGDGLFTSCTYSPLGLIRAEMFNANLYGAFAVEEAARHEPVLEAIARRPSELLCLSEVSRPEDQTLLAERAKGHGWEAALGDSVNLDSVPFDATDESGNPPPPSKPACAGVEQSEIDAGSECIRSKCIDEQGKLRDGDVTCLSSKCAGALLPLFAGNRAQQSCLNCFLSYLISYEKLDEANSHCRSDARPQYAFTGHLPSMALSKFPIVKKEVFVLPSTVFRRAVIRAEVKIDPDTGRTIDFYCVQLSPSLGGIMPYTGAYSEASDAEGWFAEERLQAKKVVALIQRLSGTRPAIISGDLNSSPEGLMNVEPRNPAALKTFADAFEHARPPTWTPTCTRCKANLLGSISRDEWTLHHLLWRFPKASVIEGGLFLDEPLKLPDGRSIAYSDTYGFSAAVRRPE